MKIWRTIAAVLGSLAATLLMVEAGTCALVDAGVLATTRPGRTDTKSQFWKGDDPRFGVWHEPNAEWTHKSPCFEVTYRTNSFGARDRERSLRSSRPRVVVLGDSMLEGWGVADDQRLTNLLEASTGIEHLNFAMAHFGPYQQLLVYRQLAARFDHDAVIFGVFPRNDFFDLTLDAEAWVDGLPPAEAQFWKFLLDEYPYVYRPYLVKTDSGFERVDYREPFLRRVLRRYSYSFNAALDAQRSIARALRARSPATWQAPTNFSLFYDLREPDLEILEEVLTRLAKATRGRRLVVLLIPDARDIARYRQTAGDRLYLPIKALGDRLGFEVVNLLFGMGAEDAAREDAGPRTSPDRSYEAYFHSCDFHWSAAGNEKARDLILEQLAPMYAELRSGRSDRPEAPPPQGSREEPAQEMRRRGVSGPADR